MRKIFFSRVVFDSPDCRTDFFGISSAALVDISTISIQSLRLAKSKGVFTDDHCGGIEWVRIVLTQHKRYYIISFSIRGLNRYILDLLNSIQSRFQGARLALILRICSPASKLTMHVTDAH